MVSSFLEMPFPLKIISAAGLSSPLAALGSLLTGSVLPDGYTGSYYDYGAARSLLELFVVIGAMLPAVVSSILLIKRSYISRALRVMSYFIACIAPFFLKAFREAGPDPFLHLNVAFFTSLVLLSYLYLFKGPRTYFRERE